MSTDKQKTGKISLANLIAIIGLVLLLIFSYLGRSYLSGGEMGFDILIAVAITSITAFLLWFLIKAKGAENKLQQWKIIELSTLIIYIVFAVVTAIYGGAMHFFTVNDNKDNLKELAREDLNSIESMFIEYKKFEEDAITQTVTGLDNAVAQKKSDDLKSYMKDVGIENSRESIDAFEKKLRSDLIGDAYKAYYTAFSTEKERIESDVKNWSVVRISSDIRSINEMATYVGERLTDLSRKYKLPKINRNSYRQYDIIIEAQSRVFSVDESNLRFGENIKEVSGTSLTAIAIIILIHLLILLNYIVAYRTQTLGFRKGQDDGGHFLNR